MSDQNYAEYPPGDNRAGFMHFLLPFCLGIGTALIVIWQGPKPEPKPVEPDKLAESLNRLEASVKRAVAERSLVVNTPCVTIYNTENLGRKPVPPPYDKAPTKEGVTDVRQVQSGNEQPQGANQAR